MEDELEKGSGVNNRKLVGDGCDGIAAWIHSISRSHFRGKCSLERYCCQRNRS